MEIKISLLQEEALEILIKHFQPIFPDKVITGEIRSYGNVELEVMDKKEPNEEIKSEDTNG